MIQSIYDQSKLDAIAKILFAIYGVSSDGFISFIIGALLGVKFRSY